MEKLDFDAMPLDDLWALHEQITQVLSTRILAQKQALEQRLLQLNRAGAPAQVSTAEPQARDGRATRLRRKYPQVFPKFQNPSVPDETWSGRGKQPRWLVAALKAGSKIEDFEIVGNPRNDAQAPC